MIYAIAFAIATLADVITTNLVISKGGRELNWVVRWFMDRLGILWWLPKATVSLVFFWAVGVWPVAQYGAGSVAAITAFVAARNYKIYRSL